MSQPIASARFTTCDHCGEVENTCEMEVWTSDATGEEHTVCYGEVDDYLADLRAENSRGRLADGTLVV